jgi:septum formation protein
MQKIILASQSPRRKELLQLAEVDFDVMVANTDESYPAGLSFEDTAMHIATNKAFAIEQRTDKMQIILAADTIVVCNDKIIGKPEDREDAIAILMALSGNTHKVITGVCILKDGKTNSFSDTTTVHFHPISFGQIIYYVDKYKPYDKAGGYAIQEWIGAIGIKKIEGDFYNVMGLPISRVVEALNSFSPSEGCF